MRGMTEALRKVSRSCVRSYVWRTAWTASLGFFSLAALAGENPVRYLRFDEVRETLLLHADSGLPGSEIKGSEAWDAWIRARDAEVRGRIEGGIEDSISNLILYGTSFTSLPRVESVEFAATETGELRPATVARIHALALALASGAKDERVRFVRDFLARKGIGKNSEESYFTENLRRFIAEQAAYQQKLQDAAKKEGEPSAVYLARGTLFETRGLSVDTSLLPNFALEETLGAMIRKSALTTGSMRRIAVIGPGLDFTDKRDGYDFYPLQTIQPFAVLEAVLRLDLGRPNTLRLTTLDLNPAVNAHLDRAVKRARAGTPYVIQLPRDLSADWTPQAVSYWEHFGELIGSAAPAAHAPKGLVVRAIAVHPKYASLIEPLDLDVV